MANQTDPQFRLAELFKQEKCYTIDQISHRLNYSLISIRRFLKTMGYYSSFTHNSKWYTLRSIPSFNKNGIWFYQDIGLCFAAAGGNDHRVIMVGHIQIGGVDIGFVPRVPTARDRGALPVQKSRCRNQRDMIAFFPVRRRPRVQVSGSCLCPGASGHTLYRRAFNPVIRSADMCVAPLHQPTSCQS